MSDQDIEFSGIANRLDRGSQNIDLMRERFVNTVKMILGFAKSTDEFLSYTREYFGDINSTEVGYMIGIGSFNTDNCRFIIRMLRGHDGKPTLQVDCDVMVNHQWMNDYTSGGTHSNIRYPTVLYEHRDTLIKVVFQLFPGIAKKWDYLLHAAEVTL